MKHFYNCTEQLRPDDVVNSLKLIQQKYKSAYLLQGLRGKEGLYPIMFQVDKGSLENNFEEPFTAVHSFTFLDWKMIT